MLDEAQRAKFLQHVRAGHDVAGACAVTGIALSEVRKAGKSLQDQIGEAFKVGTSRLQARLLEGALDSGDLRIIANVLEQRTRTEQQAAAGQLGEIRHLVQVACPVCSARRPYGDEGAAS